MLIIAFQNSYIILYDVLFRQISKQLTYALILIISKNDIFHLAVW